MNVTSCARPTDTVESRTGLYRATGESKTRRLQCAFAAHLRRLGRRYPKDQYPRVVLLMDNAPWHAGEPIRQALAEYPQLELKRLPSYSPQLNVIERFWKYLRRRATHNCQWALQNQPFMGASKPASVQMLFSHVRPVSGAS